MGHLEGQNELQRDRVSKLTLELKKTQQYVSWKRSKITSFVYHLENHTKSKIMSENVL